eukprot:CAMPEP_0194484664 /NCGR_PEP_ID=MMETSP0253-20130528/5926_1 /TAXON_ID=2966 /ORGANISM="Noctiluca scintillans" /LENGTH=255 /DNA_ID=CAMNT_0039324509 /DNA_START=121 /DNA_END=888 /DNA_ORIENTATION=-
MTYLTLGTCDADVPKTQDELEDTANDVKSIMDQLTISMAGEVIDERTFRIRDAGSAMQKKDIRLANVGEVPRRTADDDDMYEDKVSAARAALGRVVEKQMMLWKAAPEEFQPKDGSFTLADVWTSDGRHIPKLLKSEGHLVHADDFDSEWARDILSAEAEKSKAEQYRKLEEALKEDALEKRKEAKAQREAQKKAEEDAEASEPFGLVEYCALGVFLILVVGAFFNFGRAKTSSKTNMNRKRGLFEKFWIKLKGT